MLTVFYELDIGMYDGDAEQNRQLLQASIAIDPKNVIAREAYMNTLQTAWGGSTAQMKQFLASCRAAGLPAAGITELTSQVVANEAWVDDSQGNYERAGLQYLEADKLSPDGTCLVCAGSDFMNSGDYPNAVKALSDYLVRDPDSADALYLRAAAYLALRRTPDGMRDCARAAALGNSWCQNLLGWAYSIGAYGVSMDRTAAIKWLTLAAKQGNTDAERLLPIVRSGQLWKLAIPQPHPHP
ncbi:MAG: tetratricopeptide repeat protein [Steroidobacteraceae bacterium]